MYTLNTSGEKVLGENAYIQDKRWEKRKRER